MSGNNCEMNRCLGGYLRINTCSRPPHTICTMPNTEKKSADLEKNLEIDFERQMKVAFANNGP
jgi:hypothetical protein